MKTKFLFAHVLIIASATAACTLAHASKPRAKKPLHAPQEIREVLPVKPMLRPHVTAEAEKSVEQILNDYLRPVEFSKQGLSTFFRNCFLTTLYAERFLPACWVHLMDFIKFGTETHKDRAFITASFSLFQQRLSACYWVNPYTLLTFLEQAPELLAPYCSPEKNEQDLKILKRELRDALANNFGQLKKDPEIFLDATSRKILASLSANNDAGSVRELQNRMTQLLHSAISKLIWNPKEKLDIWTSVTSIGNRIQILYDANLITHVDDLNLLIWELLNRFNYFVDCAGSQLPESFYKAIQDDVIAKKHNFLLLGEREPEFTSKEDFLLQTIVLKGLVKSHAYDAGLRME
ncbi:TPA: hypothetical protein DDZ86_00265 [Candidatus Dependentiae bacterium]|nr:MAG: hypothetical protein UW09_C0002G0069 [candidate division TM6 bacterium GW2011_GWF2_43_87]HBL98062.1 hypothetical protein [Candidatus Dependentiae bacterium]